MCVRDHQGYSALHMAAARGNADVTELLLESHCPVGCEILINLYFFLFFVYQNIGRYGISAHRSICYYRAIPKKS